MHLSQYLIDSQLMTICTPCFMLYRDNGHDINNYYDGTPENKCANCGTNDKTLALQWFANIIHEHPDHLITATCHRTKNLTRYYNIYLFYTGNDGIIASMRLTHLLTRCTVFTYDKRREALKTRGNDLHDILAHVIYDLKKLSLVDDNFKANIQHDLL